MRTKKPRINGTRQAIRDELHAQKPDWIREITDAVTHALGDKIDKMYVKLDAFIGEVKARREEQTIHSGQHHDINDRLEKVEKRVGIPA